MTAYDKMGSLSVVPAADLLNKTAACNIAGDSRFTADGSHGIGKRAGTRVIRDSGPGPTRYIEVIATGSAATDVWFNVGTGAQYTPV